MQVNRIEQPSIRILLLRKPAEQYVFMYTDQSMPDLLRTLGRYAVDPELAFSWYDAAVLSQRVRQESEVGK
jgi:hypothetical protein